MNKFVPSVIILGNVLIRCTLAQPNIQFKEVDFSHQQDFWVSRIKGNKSIDLKSQFSFYINGKEFFCTKANGLIYVFDMNQELVRDTRFEMLNDGYTESSNYYVGHNLIAWRKRVNDAASQDSVYVLEFYDYERNVGRTKYFPLPKATLLQTDPVIIDTNKILIHNLIFYDENKVPDTLDVKERKIEPRSEGQTFMRKNMYITDNCSQAKARCQKEYHGLSFTKIKGTQLVTYDLNPRNTSIPIHTYRIEADFENFLFMSSKITPENFLIYDITRHSVFPFTLDNTVFNSSKMIEQKPQEVDDGNEFAPNEVEFAYTCSMDAENIYIGVWFAPEKKYRVYKVDWSKITTP